METRLSHDSSDFLTQSCAYEGIRLQSLVHTMNVALTFWMKRDRLVRVKNYFRIYTILDWKHQSQKTSTKEDYA